MILKQSSFSKRSRRPGSRASPPLDRRSDTSPLNYLIQIEAVHLLPKLYRDIVVPVAVIEELSHPSAPDAVHLWVEHPPIWIEVAQPTTSLDTTARLDRGEFHVLTLAVERRIRSVLIDETKGRREAKRLGLRPIGTLGILAAAGRQSLLDPRAAFLLLLGTTNFRRSRALEAEFFAQISGL